MPEISDEDLRHIEETGPLAEDVPRLVAALRQTRAERDQLRESYATVARAGLLSTSQATDAERALVEAETERDRLRELLVKAEGYALSSGAARPFVEMFAEDSPKRETILRAGCYPVGARREHPGRFALNLPAARAALRQEGLPR